MLSGPKVHGHVGHAVLSVPLEDHSHICLDLVGFAEASFELSS